MVMKTVAINSIILENNNKPNHKTSTSSQKNVARLFLFIHHQPHTTPTALVSSNGMIEEAVAKVDAQGFFGVQAG